MRRSGCDIFMGMGHDPYSSWVRIGLHPADAPSNCSNCSRVGRSIGQQARGLARCLAVPADIGAGPLGGEQTANFARLASSPTAHFAGLGRSDSNASTTVLFRICCASAELGASITANPAARRRLAKAERSTESSSTIKTTGVSVTKTAGANAPSDRSIRRVPRKLGST